MSIVYGPNTGLMTGAADGDLYGDAMRAFQRGVDALVMPVVKGVGTNTPPGSPADGDAYVVGTSPTGAWAAKNNQIARWYSVANAWEFYVPKAGWRVVDGSTTGQPQYTYAGSAWTTLVTTAGGINFGQTDLKNYQEGTWTPALVTGGTPTYSVQQGYYTRIGRLVAVQYFIVLASNPSPSGNISISGLPFAAASNPSFHGTWMIHFEDINITGFVGISSYPAAGSTSLTLRAIPASGAASVIAASSAGASAVLLGEAVYIA